jgi:chromate transporter
MSPGPNGLWVISLGYLTYGYLGAALALIAVILPPLLVVAVAAGYQHVEGKAWVANGVHCIGLTIVGMLLSVSWEMMSHAAGDWHRWLIGLAALLAASRRVHPLSIILLAGFAGLLERYQSVDRHMLIVGAVLLVCVGCAAKMGKYGTFSFMHRRVVQEP